MRFSIFVLIFIVSAASARCEDLRARFQAEATACSNEILKAFAVRTCYPEDEIIDLAFNACGKPWDALVATSPEANPPIKNMQDFAYAGRLAKFVLNEAKIRYAANAREIVRSIRGPVRLCP